MLNFKLVLIMRKITLLFIMLALSLPLFAQSVEVEVGISCSWGTLYATLAQPEKGSDTALVIVAGSGPTDRNGNSQLNLNTYSYKMLSDALVERGFAVLRYDKRAIGASRIDPTEIPNLVFDDFVDDALECANYLRDKGFRRVIMAGHSEGGLISLVAASREGCPLDGVVLLCAPGYAMDKILLKQLNQQLMPQYMSLVVLSSKILTRLKSGEMVPEADIPKELLSLFHPTVQPFLISNMRYEPAELARGISLPMLVITGGNDIQVSTDNGDRIAEVAPNAKHITFERMTHVLKDFNSKDRVEQVVNIYVNAKAPLTDGLVSSIVDFVNNIKY